MGKDVSYVYIVECEDTSLYTGITKDIDKRLLTHLSKKSTAAKYTRSHTVKRVRAVFKAVSYSSAAKLEYAIKRLRREKKISFIEGAFSGEDIISLYFPKLCNVDYVFLKDFDYKADIGRREGIDG